MTEAVAVMIDELLAESPGNALRQAREHAGLSQREVADKLHLLPRQVAALESDDYQHFSADIFCRGYIKSYASLLGLDFKPLLAAYLEICPTPVQQEQPSKRRAGSIQRPAKGRSLQYWCLAATLLIVVALWWGGQSTSEGELAAAVPAKVEVDGRQVELSPQIVVAENVSDAINQQSFSLPIIDQSSVEVAEAGIEVTSVVTPELRIEQPTESLATPVIIAQGNLSFSFSGDCWVKVTDSNDKVLFADLKRAEGSLRLTGQPPFAILLGDASSVSLVYNGEPITITKDDGKNSSRFVLGRL